MKQGELCPSGAEITTSNECKHALEYAPLLGITHNSRKWNGPGNWGHVPFQCSYQAGGDQAFHYNQKDAGNVPQFQSGFYKMICKQSKYNK